MSSPGGSGNWRPPEYGQPPRHDPFAGSQNPSGMRYQGFGIYDQQPPVGRRKRRGPLIAGLSLAAAVLIGGISTVLVVNANNDGQANRTPPPVPLSSTLPTSSSTAPTSESAVPPAPVVAGWQAVAVPKRGAAYDAPPEWSLETPDNIIAFGEPDDAVTMTGVAVYQKGFCPGKPSSYRAITGATARDGSSDAAIAEATAHKLATLAYSANGASPKVELTPPEQVSLDQGSARGTLVTATVTHPAPGPCDAPTSVINILARGNDGNGSVVHIGMAEQGVPDAFPPEALKTLSLSFRPAG